MTWHFDNECINQDVARQTRLAPSERQQHWLRAAQASGELAAGLFLLLALPNAEEGGHSCREHAIGFSRDGRRGFRCGVCHTVVKWIDPA